MRNHDGSTDETPSLCPSAQADAAGAVVFGVNQGTAAHPQVGYLDHPLPVTESIINLVAPSGAGAVLRIAAPCAQQGCSHFDGQRCRLATRTVRLLPVSVAGIPPCRIRASCQWWRQEGRAACRRCPQVITASSQPSELLRLAGDPATPVERLDEALSDSTDYV